MKDTGPQQPLLTSLNLENAVLCADCEVISDSNGEVCGACGSRSLLSLGRVLGGCLGTERARIIDDAERLRGGFTVLVNAGAHATLMRRRKRHS